MKITNKAKKILSYYQSDNPGTKTNLAKILMHGKLAGTGKLLILPVDQGFEHGPARSFSQNSSAYDPSYHIGLALSSGLSAFAAPLGMLEAIADSCAGSIPLILKANSANSLSPKSASPYQAMTGTVSDALRLGCSAIGFTIYPGSEFAYDMMEEVAEMIKEAKSFGLATVIWSYPRGGDITKQGETALDVIAYAAHIAALMGAHIIKVKPPSAHIEMEANKLSYKAIPTKSLSDRVKHVMQSAFYGKRLVVFSGGAAKSEDEILEEIKAINEGGASGSIIGRNSFQRSKEDAEKLLSDIIALYKQRV